MFAAATIRTADQRDAVVKRQPASEPPELQVAAPAGVWRDASAQFPDREWSAGHSRIAFAYQDTFMMRAIGLDKIR
jgi:hypothetical protein